MDSPFGHHRHNHRRERDEEEEDYPPPPPHPPTAPPPFDPHYPPSDYGEPPLPPPTDVYHTSHVPPPRHSRPPLEDFNSSRFPPEEETLDYPSPPPPNSFVSHVSHESNQPNRAPIENETHQNQHHFSPHIPAFLQHHTQTVPAIGSDLSNKPTYRVFCKSNANYSLSIHDGKVILARSDRSDDSQHWYKDEKYSTRVKDQDEFPSFSLVNKATGQAIKHSIGASHPVQLIPYNSDVLDESILWTLSKDMGDDFRAIRMVNNVRLNFEAHDGDGKHGGIRDGTTIVLGEWKKVDHKQWRISPY